MTAPRERHGKGKLWAASPCRINVCQLWTMAEPPQIHRTMKLEASHVASVARGYPETHSWCQDGILAGGEPFADALRHGTMSVEVFAPRGKDTQAPHDQDERYFVVSGKAQFICGGNEVMAKNGDVLFVPAYAKHRFLDMTEDFVPRVVFWGPRGGEH